MKTTYVFGFVWLSLFSCTIACYQVKKNSTPPPPNSLQPAGVPPSNPIVSDNNQNKVTFDSAADEIVFKADKDSPVSYNPNDYTHVVNPFVKPNITGFSVSEGFQFTDAANDRLMEFLRSKLATRVRAEEAFDRALDPKADSNAAPHDDLRISDQELAQSITMAEMRRVDSGKFEFHIWTQNDGEIILETPDIENEEDTKKANQIPLQAQNANAEIYGGSQAYCVTRTSNKELACQTVVLQLIKNGLNQSFVIFRNLPARIFLGEYTSRLLATHHNDPIIDRWVEFFHDLLTYRLVIKNSFTDAPTVAELKTFAVVNGIAAFTLVINRSQYGKFVVSGDLIASLKNASEKLNLPLQRGVLSGAEEQIIDPIYETVTDATLLNANGRGMLHIRLQLGNLNSLDLGDDSQSGGIIFNQKGLAQSGINSPNLFQRNMQIRFSFATRNKSLRLQEKSNRALRFTVVPVVSGIVEPAL